MRIKILLFIFSLGISAQTQRPKTFSLQIGEFTEIIVDEELDVNASRKGVVDILALGQGRWRITGMQRGFVILSWLDEEGREQNRTHIKVQDRALRSKSLPVKRQPPSQKELASQLGKRFNVEISEFGKPLAWAFCPEGRSDSVRELANYLTDGLVEEGRLEVMCSNVNSEENFRLSARVTLLDDSAQKELGLQAKTGATLPISSQDLSIRLSSLLNERHASVIGEPMLQLRPGVKARVHSGGEFQVLYDTSKNDGEKREGWKSLGLEIKAELLNPSAKGMGIWFSMDLRNRLNASASNTLLANSIETELNLPLGEIMVIAASDLTSSIKAESADFSFERIPIIGPLFRLRQRQNEHSRLFVWLLLEKASDALGKVEGWPKLPHHSDKSVVDLKF